MDIRRVASKIKMAVFIMAGLLGFYAVMGYYFLPTLIMSKLPALIQQETGRKATISSVRFAPFSFRLSLKGFELQEPDGSLFIGFENMFVGANALQSILQATLTIDNILLDKPVIRIARHKDGTFNFSGLIKEKPLDVGGKAFPINITKLSIAEGKLDWDDAYFNNSEKETAYPINLTVENFTAQMDKPSDLNLSLALSSGGKLDLQGAVGFSPFSSSGHVKLENMQLQKIRALALQDMAGPDMLGNGLFETNYTASYNNNGKLNASLSQGTFELRDVQVFASAQEKALVKMLRFAAHGINFNLENHALSVESIASNDADFNAWINPEGIFNYQKLMPAAKADAPSPQPQQIPWKIKINSIALNNFGLAFEDQSLKKPAALAVKPINFNLTNFCNDAGAILPFQLSAGLNGTGLIKLGGNFAIEPLSAQIAVNAKNIALENFQAYAEKFARLDIIDGMLAFDGNISFANSAQDELAVKFTGDTQITDFLTRDQLKNKDFIKWENLTLSGIDVDVPANQYNAKTLRIDKPYVRVVIKQDKTVNVSDIIIAGKTKPEAAKKNGPKPKFNLDDFQIIDGSSDFADLSLILPFAAQIKSLDGGASGISSEQKSTVKIDLKGSAYDLAPVDIKGEISPYLGDYDVQLNFTGMPMPLISSYMVQFAGYKVEKGKMSLELAYKVADNELSASNNILIDQFELGEKVENPNAVTLPLKLAVALMKDSDGKIKIHVPITGSLEDPKFSVRHIVADALVNAIGKVVTSPFRALASLVGSKEDLSSISFAAGSSELNKQEIKKLDDLAKALKERPALNLEIKGAVFQGQDWPAVSDDALYDQLKRIKAAEVNKQGERKIRAEYVVISDQDYRRLMEQLFVEKFPLMVEKTLSGKLRLVGGHADTDTDEFYAVAKEKLSAIIQPEQQRLKNLAAERAQAIASYIVQKGGIANERVFILDTVIDPERKGDGIVSMLSLKEE